MIHKYRALGVAPGLDNIREIHSILQADWLEFCKVAIYYMMDKNSEYAEMPFGLNAMHAAFRVSSLMISEKWDLLPIALTFNLPHKRKFVDFEVHASDSYYESELITKIPKFASYDESFEVPDRRIYLSKQFDRRFVASIASDVATPFELHGLGEQIAALGPSHIKPSTHRRHLALVEKLDQECSHDPFSTSS